LRLSRLQSLVAIALLTAILTLLIPSPALAQEIGGFNPQSWLQSALQWIDDLGFWGPFAFIVLYVVATVGFLPGSIVTLGAGVVFGVVEGSLYVFIGAMLGATAAFIVGRYIARDWVAGKIAGNQRFKAIDDAIGREGRKIIFLIRLSPAFPFNLLNYALGLTRVSLKDYVLGTTGIIPGTIMYVYLGSLAGSLAMIGAGETPSNLWIQWTIRIVGFIATVAVTVYVTRIARKALREAVPEATDGTAERPEASA
jgi:uncharacterized membrane protein YdjX (TVP38/TMEM64 family)